MDLIFGILESAHGSYRLARQILPQSQDLARRMQFIAAAADKIRDFNSRVPFQDNALLHDVLPDVRSTLVATREWLYNLQRRSIRMRMMTVARDQVILQSLLARLRDNHQHMLLALIVDLNLDPTVAHPVHASEEFPAEDEDAPDKDGAKDATKDANKDAEEFASRKDEDVGEDQTEVTWWTQPYTRLQITPLVGTQLVSRQGGWFSYSVLGYRKLELVNDSNKTVCAVISTSLIERKDGGDAGVNLGAGLPAAQAGIIAHRFFEYTTTEGAQDSALVLIPGQKVPIDTPKPMVHVAFVARADDGSWRVCHGGQTVDVLRNSCLVFTQSDADNPVPFGASASLQQAITVDMPFCIHRDGKVYFEMRAFLMAVFLVLLLGLLLGRWAFRSPAADSKEAVNVMFRVGVGARSLLVGIKHDPRAPVVVK